MEALRSQISSSSSDSSIDIPSSAYPDTAPIADEDEIALLSRFDKPTPVTPKEGRSSSPASFSSSEPGVQSIHRVQSMDASVAFSLQSEGVESGRWVRPAPFANESLLKQLASPEGLKAGLTHTVTPRVETPGGKEGGIQWWSPEPEPEIIDSPEPELIDSPEPEPELIDYSPEPQPEIIDSPEPEPELIDSADDGVVVLEEKPEPIAHEEAPTLVPEDEESNEEIDDPSVSSLDGKPDAGPPKSGAPSNFTTMAFFESSKSPAIGSDNDEGGAVSKMMAKILDTLDCTCITLDSGSKKGEGKGH